MPPEPATRSISKRFANSSPDRNDDMSPPCRTLRGSPRLEHHIRIGLWRVWRNGKLHLPKAVLDARQGVSIVQGGRTDAVLGRGDRAPRVSPVPPGARGGPHMPLLPY